MKITHLHPRANREHWGYIPDFLNEADERPAREQFGTAYCAGWNPFEGFTFRQDPVTLTYPGDPPMRPIGMLEFRQEKIYLFDHAWVLILQPDGTWEVSRMD